MLISTQKQMICQLVYPDHRDEYFAAIKFRGTFNCLYNMCA